MHSADLVKWSGWRAPSRAFIDAAGEDIIIAAHSLTLRDGADGFARGDLHNRLHDSVVSRTPAEVA